jgi:hypothetical protein
MDDWLEVPSKHAAITAYVKGIILNDRVNKRMRQTEFLVNYIVANRTQMMRVSKERPRQKQSPKDGIKEFFTWFSANQERIRNILLVRNMSQ